MWIDISSFCTFQWSLLLQPADGIITQQLSFTIRLEFVLGGEAAFVFSLLQLHVGALISRMMYGSLTLGGFFHILLLKVERFSPTECTLCISNINFNEDLLLLTAGKRQATKCTCTG